MIIITNILYANLGTMSIAAPKIDITDNFISAESNSKNLTLDKKLENDVSYNIVKDNHNKNTISFRGIQSRATNVIEDLIPSYKTTAGNIDFYYNHGMYDISSNMLISPSSLGVSSMGSDIELLTKKPQRKFEAQINTSISQSDNEQKLYLGSKQKNYFVQFNLNRYKSDQYKLSDDFSVTAEQPSKNRLNSDNQQNSYELKAGVNLTDKDSLTLKYQNSKSNFGINPNVYDNSIGYQRINKKDLESFYGYYDHIDENYETNIRLYYDDYQDIFDDYTDNTYTSLRFPSSLFDNSRLGFITKTKFKKDRDELSFILKMQEDEHIWKRDGSSYIPKFKYRDISASVIGKKEYNNITLNTAITYKNFKPVTVDYDGDPTFTQTEDGTSNDALDYQIGLNYLIDTNLWYISHSKTTRTPAMTEMFAFFSWDKINTDLKAESSKNIEIGYKRFLDYGLYSLAIFNYDIKDKIVTTNNKATNLDKATHKGIEFRYENRYFNKHDFKLSYLYTEAKDDSNNDLELIPENKLVIEDKINLSNRYSANIQYIYTAKRKDNTTSGVKTLSAYSLINLSLYNTPRKTNNIL
jgi:hypothetical protein